jgi:hypothetical protein
LVVRDLGFRASRVTANVMSSARPGLATTLQTPTAVRIVAILLALAGRFPSCLCGSDGRDLHGSPSGAPRRGITTTATRRRLIFPLCRPALIG